MSQYFQVSKSDNNYAVLYYTVDRPLYSEQVDMVLNDLQDFVARYAKSSKLTNTWWQLFDSISHDGYGSFVLDFELGILDLDEKTQSEIYYEIMDIINCGDFMCAMNSWISIEEDHDYALQCFEEGELVSTYVNSVLDCGYNLNERDIVETLTYNFDADDQEKIRQEVREELLLKKIEFPNRIKLHEQHLEKNDFETLLTRDI